MATNRLQTDTFPGFPDGMNVAYPSNEIKDTQARYLQDVWVHEFGFTTRRGPIVSVPAMVSFSDKITGIVQSTDPAGTVRIGVLHGSASTGFLGILSSDFTSKVDISLGMNLPTAPYTIVDAKPMLNGGTLIGLSSQYEGNAGSQELLMWHGGNLADYTTGTLTTTSGSKTVAGSGTSWLSAVSPGMFLMSSTSQYIGTIQSVESNTSLTLIQPPLVIVSGATYTAQALRGWNPRYVAGHVTVGSGATAVTGANTKFQDQGVASGWKLFRASDGLLVGTVTSVTSNTSLTLAAGATVAMSSGDYELIDDTGDYTFDIKGKASKVGFLNAVYAERQWYANQARAADASGEFVNRLWFSSEVSPESVDLSTVDGDFIPVTSAAGVSSPIKAIIPAYNSMLVLKERESFVLVGNNPNNFEIRKLSDDGILSGMSAVAYQGGVIWAGREGIYYYDGVEATNIVEKTLGAYYSASVKGFDPRTYRMWGLVHRDHYLLHIERVAPSVPVVKGNASNTPTQFTIAIYMPRQAVTTHTNLNHRGGVTLPASTGQNSWFVVNDNTKGWVAQLDQLFDSDGNDPFGCDGGTAGPDFYIESKKYSLGDGLRKKLWKQLMLHYLVGGDSLRLDTIVGLNTVGSTATSTWPITVYTWDKLSTLFATWDTLANSYPTWDSLVDSVFFLKRIKFIKRSQYLAFRIYQTSTSVNKVTMGSFALGYKWQREGRI